MSDQLENLNLNYKRLDAISIDGLISSKNEKYWETWERPIKLTERACFLSHIKAWEKVKNINRPLLIL
jgi:glycosyl transferase family 25